MWHVDRATPLYTIIDSGMGKESADSKLRESIKLYASLPQCKLVLFSAHDASVLHPPQLPSLMEMIQRLLACSVGTDEQRLGLENSSFAQ